MAQELGLAERARFVEANVYDARHRLPEPESFDLVFTTWGTIGWLPDVAEWARIIAWFLKPGGRLYFADGHPAAFVFDGDEGAGGLPTFAYPYTSTEVIEFDDPSDYADPEAQLRNSKTSEWIHPLGEVLGALRDAGLVLDDVREHSEVPWQIFPVTVPKGDGMYGWPSQQWLPLSYEVVATRDAPGR